MKRKKYELPELEMMEIQTEDVIMESITLEYEDDELPFNPTAPSASPEP